MDKERLREWQNNPVTEEAFRQAEERAGEYNEDILRLLSTQDSSGRATYLAGVINGLKLAFEVETEDEDEE